VFSCCGEPYSHQHEVCMHAPGDARGPSHVRLPQEIPHWDPEASANHPTVFPSQVFRDLDFTLLEMNPFTLDAAGLPFPLDMRGELDDTAAFKSGKKWGAVEFPLPFGRSMTSAEERILAMDENTGARVAAQWLASSAE